MVMIPMKTIVHWGDYMRTKYNHDIPDESLSLYFDKLIGKIFKILPMKESNIDSVQMCCMLLICELLGGKAILMNEPMIIELIFSLEAIMKSTDKGIYKPLIMKCIGICENLSYKFKEGDNL